MRQKRAQVGRVVVVQMGEKHMGDVAVVEPGLDKSAKRSVSAVHEVGLSGRHEHARHLVPSELDVRSSLRAKENETGSCPRTRLRKGAEAG